MKWFLDWMKRRGSWRMIKRDGKDYLERYFLFRAFGHDVYLHCFWTSDPDDCHDHPYDNNSFLLKGGYREYYLDGSFKDRVAGDWIHRQAEVAHRIEVVPGTEGKVWSLFHKGRRRRDWGFHTKKGWMDASEYDREPTDVYGRDFIYKGRLFPRIIWLNNAKNQEK